MARKKIKATELRTLMWELRSKRYKTVIEVEPDISSWIGKQIKGVEFDIHYNVEENAISIYEVDVYTERRGDEPIYEEAID